MKLSESEEKVMEIIWQNDAVFLKDIIAAYPDPKPAKTTIATLLKRMQDKGYVGYKLFGNSRQYYAMVSKKEYFSDHIGNIVSNFFENSTLKFASFFTRSGKMSTEELEKLKEIVDQQIDNQKK
ncbi:MAG: BlaI/MecI/CopY family transcriptional regulator [Bacteroidota bacterium]